LTPQEIEAHHLALDHSKVEGFEIFMPTVDMHTASNSAVSKSGSRGFNFTRDRFKVATETDPFRPFETDPFVSFEMSSACPYAVT
jgi:hypothetical protein